MSKMKITNLWYIVRTIIRTIKLIGRISNFIYISSIRIYLWDFLIGRIFCKLIVQAELHSAIIIF